MDTLASISCSAPIYTMESGEGGVEDVSLDCNDPMYTSGSCNSKEDSIVDEPIAETLSGNVITTSSTKSCKGSFHETRRSLS